MISPFNQNFINLTRKRSIIHLIALPIFLISPRSVSASELTSSQNQGKQFTQTVSAFGVVCGLLNDGTMECKWNKDSQNIRIYNFKSPAVQITAGTAHVCALLKNSIVNCFGNNDAGQAPASIQFSRPVIEISAGASKTCALLNDGTIECIGYNLGEVSAPKTFAFDFPALKIVSGFSQTCAILTDGSVGCFGYTGHNENASYKPRYYKFGKVVELTAVADEMCFLLHNRITLNCDGYDGQSPRWYDFKKPVNKISLTADGLLAAFEDGSTQYIKSPIVVNGYSNIVFSKPVIEFSSGSSGERPCALVEDSGIECVNEEIFYAK